MGLSKYFFSVTHYNSQRSLGREGGEKKIALQTQFVRKMANTSIKSFELPVCAQCIVGYLRQKSGHQLSKNSHIEILTSDLVLFIKVWIVFSQRSFKLQFFIQAVALLYSSLSPS